MSSSDSESEKSSKRFRALTPEEPQPSTSRADCSTPVQSDTERDPDQITLTPKKSLKELIAEGRKTRLSRSSTGVAVMDPFEPLNKYKVVSHKRTAYIEQISSEHLCLWDENYPENPERATEIKKRFEALNLLSRCEILQPEEQPSEFITALHSRRMVDDLRDTSQRTIEDLRVEASQYDSVYFCPETYDSAKSAVDAAVTLTLKVANGQCKNGFALIRPPGHHAMPDSFCGYCFLNNAAISAEAAIEKGYAKKVLIVDYDVHHGQGTQQMFYNRKDVLYFSIHRYEDGTFWPHLPESDSNYVGEGEGKGYNVNVPLNEIGLGDGDYLAVVTNLLLPLAYEFNPDLIIISAGYDAAVGCPEGQMNVNPHFYAHLISLLSGLANGKIVVCLEGGYFIDSLAEGATWTLKALLDEVPFPLTIQHDLALQPSVIDVINNVKYFLRDHWQCFQAERFFDYPKVPNDLTYTIKDEHVTTTNYMYEPEEMTVHPTADCYPMLSEEEHVRYVSLVKQLRFEYAKGRIYHDLIGYVYDDYLLKHKPTKEDIQPVEKPERLTEIMRVLQDFDLLERLVKIESYRSPSDIRTWITAIHGSVYIRNVLQQVELTEKADFFFNDSTSECILKSVGLIVSLAQNITKGSVRAGVAIIRPPGHHASSEGGFGFCFVNNVVITANFLIAKGYAKKVLILDFDVHHGNGTQQLTYCRDDIMYISVHRFDQSRYFPYLPEANHTYKGKGYNINIPFNKGPKSDSDYWAVWCRLVLPAAYSFDPDFVIVSAGFDAGVNDPLGGYKVSPEMFGHMITTIRSIASGKILVALEGGYNMETTAMSMAACVKGLLGDPLPVPDVTDKISEDTVQTIHNVCNSHRDKWPLLGVTKKIANFACTKLVMDELVVLEPLTGENARAEMRFRDLVKQHKYGQP